MAMFDRWNKMIEDYKASRTHEAGNDPARREPDTLPENDRDQEQNAVLETASHEIPLPKSAKNRGGRTRTRTRAKKIVQS